MKENKLPCLTKEERDFFLEKEVFYKKLRNKYEIWRPLYRRIGESLHSLAITKLIEGYKKEAVKYHLKACKYYPNLSYHRSRFRKEVGLFVYE